MMRKMAKKLDSSSNTEQIDSGMKLFKDVTAKMKYIYKQKIYPLERHHRFHDLQNGPLEDGEFDAKPTVLLLGQYSTGEWGGRWGWSGQAHCPFVRTILNG